MPKYNANIAHWIRSGAAFPYPFNGTEVVAIACVAKHRQLALQHGFDLGYRLGRLHPGWELVPRIIQD